MTDEELCEDDCEHVKALRHFLMVAGLTIWSEHGEEPAGWVNVGCAKCGSTLEIALDLERARDDD